MRVCGNCFENNFTNTELKFVKDKKLKQFLAMEDICVNCHLLLIEQNKDKMESLKNVKITFKPNIFNRGGHVRLYSQSYKNN